MLPSKNNPLLSTVALCLASLLTSPLSHAESRPLWEIGAGVGALSLPDYRGSDVSGTYIVPIPYLIYRGDYLKADRNGLRGILFDSDKVQVNLSLNATLPVNSKDNAARRGMADLRPTVEVGPSANFRLWHSAEKNTRLEFRAPVRAGITVESAPKQIGWLFTPSLNLDVSDPSGLPGWNLGLQVGPYFQDRKYNAHFYSVSAAEATPTRAAYTAKGGYSGSQITASMSKRFARYWIGSFVRYDNLAGSVIGDSSLVKKHSNVSAGIAISWVFGESSQSVNVEE